MSEKLLKQLVVASSSHSDARTQVLLDKLGNYDCVSIGSSLKMCSVAEGAAHIYPRLGPTMEWNIAAAHAVVITAGGVVHDSECNELRYNKPDVHNSELFLYAAMDKMLSKAVEEIYE